MLNDAAMLPRLTALLALALGLLRIAALSLHPDKLIADAPFSLADEVEYDARSRTTRAWTSSCVRSAGGFLSVAKMWA